MFFKTKAEEKTYDDIEEKIKKDLVSTLQKKGIDISLIHIDLKSGSVNLSLKITGNS